MVLDKPVRRAAFPALFWWMASARAGDMALHGLVNGGNQLVHFSVNNFKDKANISPLNIVKATLETMSIRMINSNSLLFCYLMLFSSLSGSKTSNDLYTSEGLKLPSHHQPSTNV